MGAGTTTMMPLLLLGAHLVGDFVTQTRRMAAQKLTDWRVRASHVTAYTAGFAVVLLLAPLNWAPYAGLLAAIWVTHFITDSRRWSPRDPWPPKQIMVDQTIHVLTLALLGVAFGL